MSDSPKSTPVSNTSGVAAIIQTVQIPLSSLVKPILQEAKRLEESDSLPLELADLLERHVVTNSFIAQSFDKIAILSCDSPQLAFDEVKRFFFPIPLDDSPIQGPTLDKFHWISRTSERKFTTSTRGVLFYVSEFCTADIIRRVLIANHNKTSDFSFIINEYLDPTIQQTRDPLRGALFSQLAHIFEEIIYYLSLSSPKSTFEYLLNFLKTHESMPLQTKTILYVALRSFTFQNLPRSEIDSAAPTFKTALDDFIVPQPLSRCQIAASLFFSSMTADLLTNFVPSSDNRPNHLIYLLFNIATAPENHRHAVVFPLLCILFTLSDDGRGNTSLSQILTIARKLVRQTPNSEILILTGLNRILSGRNFLPHCVEMSSPSVLTWSMHEASDAGSVFSILLACTSFAGCKNELVSFLILLCVNRPDAFISSYIHEFETSSFMKTNGICVFEAGIKLVPHGDDDMTSTFTDICRHFVNEYGAADRTNKVPGIPDSQCAKNELFLSSAPVSPVTPSQKRLLQDVSRLIKVVQPKDRSAFTLDLKVTLPLSNDTSVHDSALARCLSLIPLLGFNETLCSFAVSRLLDPSAFTASLAARCLMLLSLHQPTCATHIIGLILELAPVNHAQFYIIINALVLVFKGLPKDRCVRSVNEKVAPLIVTGLCSTSFEVRLRTIDLIELTSLYYFFDRHDKDITAAALNRISRVFGSDCDIGSLIALQFPHFRDFAGSKYEILHHIYLSVAFRFLSVTKDFRFFSPARPMLITAFKLLKDSSNIDSRVYAVNVATYLISTADSLTSSSEVRSIIHNVVQLLDSDSGLVHLLYSFAGAVSAAHFPLMLQQLESEVETKVHFLRAMTFAAQLYVSAPENPCSSDVLSQLLTSLDGVVRFFDKIGAVSSKKIISGDFTKLNDQLVLCLSSFIAVIDLLSSRIARDSTPPSSGPILHNPKPSKTMGRAQWFYFMFNLATLPDTFPSKVRTAAESAFASFCSVNAIPDDSYSALIDDVLRLVPQNTTAGAYILSHSPSFLFEHFVSNSPSEPHFFACICRLFPTPNSPDVDAQLLVQSAKRTPSLAEREFCDTLYSQLGNLIALSILFLSGEKTGFESDSRKLLYHLTLAGSLWTGNSKLKDALKILHDGSSRSLQRLSVILSDAFSFCAEQVIAQSLALLSFSLNSKSSNSLFSTLIQPWFSHVVLSCDSTIVPGSLPVFLRHGSTSFLTEFIAVTGQLPLQPSALSLIDTVARSKYSAEHFFIFCFASHRRLSSPSRVVALHLCRQHRELAEACSSYLTLRFWFYHTIQLRTFDRFFDFEKFVNKMMSTEAERARLGDNSSPEDVAFFALDICSELASEYPFVKPALLSFCLTHPRSETTEALFRVTGSGCPSIGEIRQCLGAQIREFFEFCFEWATLCGDTEIALNAAFLCIETVTDPNEKMVEQIVAAIKTTVAVLRENSAPTSKKQKRHLAKLLQGDCTVDLRLFYRHIAALLELLVSICSCLHSISIDALSVLFSFASCGDSEFQPIFESFVSSALTVSDGVCGDLSNYGEIKLQNGIIIDIATFNILLDKRKADRIINNLFIMASQVLQSGHDEVFVTSGVEYRDSDFGCGGIVCENDNSRLCAAVLWLCPYLLSTNCDELVFEEIADRCEGITNVFCLRNDEFGEEQIKTISELVSCAGKWIISAIIKFYSLVLNHTSRYSDEIFRVCAALLETCDVETIQCFCMRRVAVPAIKEKGDGTSLTKFLGIYQQKVGDFDALPGLTTSSLFPVHIGNVEINSSAEFPLYPTEPSFFYFDIIEELRNKCLAIKVDPFDKWSELVFQASLVTVEAPVIENCAPEVSQPDVLRFLKLMNTDVMPSNVDKAGKLSVSESKANISGMIDDSLCLLVPAEEFTPSTDLIKSIGLDLTEVIF